MKDANEITVLIDIDDVLGDLCGAWIKWLNDKYGYDVKNSDITEWNMNVFFPELSKEQLYEPLNTYEFWDHIEPKENASSGVMKLILDGYHVYLCTSTSYKNIRAKYENFIMKFFPFIPWDHVIVAKEKQMIKADFLIDDAIHNLVGGDYIKILFTAPHNLCVDTLENGMIRANSWDDVYEIIHSLTGENK